MTVAMVPRDQLTAATAANRHLRDELARVEAERDALLVVRDAASDPFLVLLETHPDCDPPANAEMARAARSLRAALAPFRKDGPPTSGSPAVAGSSQPAPEDGT